MHAAIWPVANEYMPTVQPTQFADSAALVVVKYNPDAQGVQVTVPKLAAYVPAAHPRQLKDSVAPDVVKYSPTAQLVHVTVPKVDVK